MKIDFRKALIGAPEGYEAGELDGRPFVIFTARGNQMMLMPDRPEEGQQLCALLGFMATSLFIRMQNGQIPVPDAAPASGQKVPSNLVGIDGKPILG